MMTQFLQDDKGGLSMMRLLVLIVVIAVLAQWLILTYKTGQPQKLDWSQVTLVLGALGAKAGQKFFEAPDSPEPPKPAAVVAAPVK